VQPLKWQSVKAREDSSALMRSVGGGQSSSVDAAREEVRTVSEQISIGLLPQGTAREPPTSRKPVSGFAILFLNIAT
jgi:hypothetical protein